MWCPQLQIVPKMLKALPVPFLEVLPFEEFSPDQSDD